MIAGEVIHQAGAPSKKVFRITKKGKNAITDWLMEEPELPGFKHEFLIKLSFGARLPNEALLLQLDRYEEKLTERLAAFHSEKKKEFMRFSRDTKEYVLWELTFQNGMMYYTNELEWVNLAKQRLRSEETELKP